MKPYKATTRSSHELKITIYPFCDLFVSYALGDNTFWYIFVNITFRLTSLILIMKNIPKHRLSIPLSHFMERKIVRNGDRWCPYIFCYRSILVLLNIEMLLYKRSVMRTIGVSFPLSHVWAIYFWSVVWCRPICSISPRAPFYSWTNFNPCVDK